MRRKPYISGRTAFFRWLWVALCIAAIFLVVPLARAIRGFVSDQWGREYFGYAVFAAAAAAFAAAVYTLYFRMRIRRPARYMWLAATASAYIYFTWSLREAPEEAIHFLEYGLLGFFLFRALSLTVRDKTIYLDGLLIGAVVGVVDEIIQWMVPGRYWDLRDVGLNILAVGLFQLALWKGIKPRIISKKTSPVSIRRSSVLAAVFLVLIGLCLSNTPQRVARYTRFFPFLDFLKAEEAMSELTYRHRDPDIGLFHSRLTLHELSRQDRNRAEEFGGVLRHWKDKHYKTFLRFFPSSVHPFLYEFRVHAFRRDRYFEKAAQAESRAQAEEFYLVAHRENLILKKYFSRTLARSPYSWDEEQAALAAEKADKKAFYKSPVGSRLLAGVREGTIWGVILGLLLLLAAFNMFISRSHRFA